MRDSLVHLRRRHNEMGTMPKRARRLILITNKVKVFCAERLKKGWVTSQESVL